MTSFVDTNTPTPTPPKVEKFIYVVWTVFTLLGLWFFFRSYQKGNFEEDLVQNSIWLLLLAALIVLITFLQKRSVGR